MVFATGIAGRLAQSLAVSVIIALMASLFVALTIVPMLAAWMFRAHKKKGAQTAEGPRCFHVCRCSASSLKRRADEGI
jgi:HAE1 family hydrophobic/amphiphilic exporter-1